jgi:hypothetical protein
LLSNDLAARVPVPCGYNANRKRRQSSTVVRRASVLCLQPEPKTSLYSSRVTIVAKMDGEHRNHHNPRHFQTMGTAFSNPFCAHTNESTSNANLDLGTATAQTQFQSFLPLGDFQPLPLNRQPQPPTMLIHQVNSTVPSRATAQRPPLRRRAFNEYEEFYLLIKILFRFLARVEPQSSISPAAASSLHGTGHDGDRQELLQRAKSVVAECIRRNRAADPDYFFLALTVERHLRPVVGEQHWRTAQSYTLRFLQKHSVHESRYYMMPPLLSDGGVGV